MINNTHPYKAVFLFWDDSAFEIQTFIPKSELPKTPDVTEICALVYKQVMERVEQFSQSTDDPHLKGWYVTDDLTGEIIFSCSDTTGYYVSDSYSYTG